MNRPNNCDHHSNIPHLFRWKGSVIPNVIGQTLIVTAFSAAVTVVFYQTNIKPAIPQTFIPVLGFVVGLLLTYRTNTAYDRYWEGRKTWSTMLTAIRNITRYIWVGVKRKEIDADDDETFLLKKISAIRLLVGFAYAVKHYLRDEKGKKFEEQVKEIQPFISNITSELPGFTHLTGECLNKEDNVPNFLTNFLKFLSSFSISHKNETHQDEIEKTEKLSINNYNLPLEISLYISDYITTQLRLERIGVPLANNLLTNVNSLIDCLSSFERILTTPIPLAYSIHLSQTVWIYCLSLSFQLVGTCGWSTIVIVFLATFILLGIESIAAEIENPFGDDKNDLNLDLFCKTLEEEVDQIIFVDKIPDIEDWVFDEKNKNAINAKKEQFKKAKEKLKEEKLKLAALHAEKEKSEHKINIASNQIQ